MFIFNRSFWAVAAGLSTACAIVAASFLLNQPASLPEGNGPAAASSETVPQAVLTTAPAS
jgi:hypothetical protein